MTSASASVPNPARLHPSVLLAFLAAFVAALLLAFHTDHVWEDYYITYRSSKNLATGNGLVYNVGDRLHTFTSPLGVLLPAVASLLTANSSDIAALWIFRFMSAAALGGAAALAVSLARRLGYPVLAVAFLAALVATDAKALDFSINGMETGFLLLFVAYTMWAHFVPGQRRWLHLGAAWAGLMWSRPDSFLYLGALAGAAWIFNEPARTGVNRWQLWGEFLRAGLLTTLLYGPWFAWAWWYYGSPVPHTIVAKGAISSSAQILDRLREGVWQMPWSIWQGRTAAEGAFLPSYYMFPSWPEWMLPFGRILATVAAFLWLGPKMRVEVRMASFAFLCGAAYLSFVPYFPFPWYFPSITLLAFFALAGLLAQLLSARLRPVRWVGIAAAAIVVCGASYLTIGTAHHAKAQQELVETGNRRVIGEWLRAHAEPGDTVFMEPLGYIGFFSGLKTYDWPGLSSREVPRATQLVGSDWANLIRYLQPNWLVMRATGEGDLPRVAPHLATYSYERVRDFNRLPEIAQVDVYGRKLLEFDSHFVLYRRREPLRHDTNDFEIASLFPAGVMQTDGGAVHLVHAPGTMIAQLPATAEAVALGYGFVDGAHLGEKPTDGAVFEVWLSDGKQRTRLFQRSLDPAARTDERGLQRVTVELPPRKNPAQARLVLEIVAGRDVARDWTYWSDPHFLPSGSANVRTP